MINRIHVAHITNAKFTFTFRLKPAKNEAKLQKQDNRLETLSDGFTRGWLLALFGFDFIRKTNKFSYSIFV